MTPPIVVDENGDVSFYPSVEAAARALEPIDVKNNEYIAYDSEGFILQLAFSGPNVIITGHGSATPALGALTEVLQSFWERAATPAPKAVSLNHLVTQSVERFGYAT
jgi:hypothetical protein